MPLEDVIDAVADGTEIDWAAAEAAVRGTPSAQTLNDLKILSQLRQLHTSGAPSELSTSAVGTGAASPQALCEEIHLHRWGKLQLHDRVGAGASCVVYRARDPELDRDVALKLLRSTEGAQRLEEGRRLARVRHPNIVTVHGADTIVGETGANTVGGISGIWMEFIDGATLHDVVRERGTLGAHEAAVIGRDICRALAAVHGAALLHRDLTAKNVMRERGGRIVLMDFGIGISVPPTGKGGNGSVAGTPLYTAPEVLRGEPPAVQADIYSLGVLLWYLVTGSYPHHALSLPELSEAASEPVALRNARADLPEEFARVVERAVAPRASERYPNAGAMERALSQFLSPGSDPAWPDRQTDAEAQEITKRSPATSRVVGGVAALLLTIVTALLVLLPGKSGHNVSVPIPVRLNAELGADLSLANTHRGAAALISPDGTTIAFVARKTTGGTPRLYVRRLNQPEPAALSGTDDPQSPFFSPDGQWIGFFAGGKLKKIAVTGGAAVTLCDSNPTWSLRNFGGAWAEDGTILFPTDGTHLQRVSADTGRGEPLPAWTEPTVRLSWPQILPGGKAVLFTSGGGPGGDSNNTSLVVQPLPSGARKVLNVGGYYGRYVSSGHLVFMRDGTLFAVPFDLDRLEVAGQQVPIVRGVKSNPGGGAQFAVSNTGTLVYLPGKTSTTGLPMQWLDRKGTITTTTLWNTADWLRPQFAPDGRRLAINMMVPPLWQIGVYESKRETLTRLTFGSADAHKPVWSPTGGTIVFSSNRTNPRNLYWQRADGTSDVERLTESAFLQMPGSWHPSGQFIAFEEEHPKTSFDLMIAPMEGDDRSGWKAGKPTSFLSTPFDEREPVFSPDGRWIAYESNEAGPERVDVYVKPFPGPGGKWQISTSGGMFPIWSRTKRELFYSSPNQQIMVVPYTVEGDAFRAEQPRLWSDKRYMPRGRYRMFDFDPDGERFVLTLAEGEDGAKQDHVTFVFNFFDELRRMVPAMKR